MNQNDRKHHTIDPALSILVDGFRFKSPSIKAYFLTHFHSDHYSGLDEDFPWGGTCVDGAPVKLYCSEITAAVAVTALRVHPRYVIALRFGEPVRILDSFVVTLVPANHCPGAAMLLFELPDGRRVLHTGDMRFDPSMLSYPALSRAVQPPGIADVLLDSTYAHPRHTFGSQSESVDEVIAILRRYLDAERAEGPGGTTLATSDGNARLLASPPTKAQSLDNSRYALSESDLVMRRADSASDSIQSLAVGDRGGNGGGAVCAGLVIGRGILGPAGGGGEAGNHSTERWVEDGQWGTGFVAHFAGSLPIPVQPTHATYSLVRRFAHLATPPPPIADTGRTLFLVSTYATGKERILVGIARALKVKVYLSQRKLRMVELLGLDRSDLCWFSDDKRECGVHVVGMDACGRSFPYFQPNWQGLERYLHAVNAAHDVGARGTGSWAGIGRNPDCSGGSNTDEAEEEVLLSQGPESEESNAAIAGTPRVPAGRYSRIVGIVPTGWVYKAKKREYESPSGCAFVHLVPYSEHSSFTELCAFVKFLRPARVTPTVYADEKDSDRIKALFAQFVNQKEAIKAFFSCASANAGGAAGQPQAGTDAEIQVLDEEGIELVDEISDEVWPAHAGSRAASPTVSGPHAGVSSCGSGSKRKREVDLECAAAIEGTAVKYYCHACHCVESMHACSDPYIECSHCGSGFVERVQLGAAKTVQGTGALGRHDNSGDKGTPKSQAPINAWFKPLHTVIALSSGFQ